MNQSEPDEFEEMLLQLRNNFLDALPEKFERIEYLLLQMERQGSDTESFNEVYRIVHSLKGSGGTFGLHIITTLCHQFEDLLSTTSQGAAFTKKQISCSLVYVDLLRTANGQIHSGNENFTQIEKRLLELRKEFAPQQFTVMLVDNSKMLNDLCAQALSGLPVCTVSIHDGLEALTRALSEPFDLVITDNEIPRLNGAALIGALRLSNSPNRHIKAIIISSNNKFTLSLNQASDPDYAIFKDAKLVQNLADKVKLALSISR
jgi:CheY-like chemotaxis protein